MKPARIITAVATSLMPSVLSGLIMTSTVAAQTTGDLEDPKELIAAQVRDQGKTCDTPQSAKREQDQSDEEVWILECDNATYRVKIVPDMAATIEQIE